MQLHDLLLFEAAARRGTFSDAAHELRTVQPAVSTRIKRLEAELGQALFRRHRWGVSLTPAGERLLPYARAIAQLAAEAREAVGEAARLAPPRTNTAPQASAEA